MQRKPAEPETTSSTLDVVGRSESALWGLSASERMRRLFAPLQVAPADGDRGAKILVHADYLLESRVAVALAAARDCILTIASGQGRTPFAAHVSADQASAVAVLLERGGGLRPEEAPAGVAVRDVSELVPSYNYQLRKREAPVVVKLGDVAERDVEWRTFMATYKGVTDIVTKYVWPWPAFWATRWSAHRGITPNAITSVGLMLAVAACFLFAQDRLWLGLAAAWLMTFLDTVDGKLARTTLTFSKWGALYDHAIDMVHQPFWWGAWWLALRDDPDPNLALLDWCAVVAIGGYVAERLIEEVFKRAYKVRIHVWERIDSTFRLITARRNPNLVILTVCMLAGAPVAGFVLLAAWTAISVVFHLVRFFQAGRQQASGRRLRSWLEQSA